MGLLKIMSKGKADAAYAQMSVEARPSKVEEKVAKVEANVAEEVEKRAQYLNRYNVNRGDLKVNLLAEGSVALAEVASMTERAVSPVIGDMDEYPYSELLS